MLEVRRGSGSLPDRLRLRAIAAVVAGPRAILPVLAAVALLAGVAGVLLIVLGSASGRQLRSNQIAEGALAALALAGAGGLVAHRFLPRRSAGQSPRGDLLTAAMLTATALLPLLLLPVHYLAARTHPSTLHWNSYGFLDKRWLTTSFLILTAGTALLLVVAARVVATTRAEPGSWREWLREMVPPRPPGATAETGEPEGEAVVGDRHTRSRRRLLVALKVVCAVAVAAYFFGPPWNLPHKPIDYHETNTMGGVQAIRTGSIPYIDAAAVQYGPGAQVANYAYATATGHLSVDGFRQVTLIFNWLAATLFLAALYLRARPLVAAVTTIAAVTLFPTLQIFHIDSRGVVDGFWGWGNTLRYAAVFGLAMLFPAIVARAQSRSTRAWAVALGAMWGLLCLVAQENLIGGALVLGMLSVLLVATDTAARRAVVSALLFVGAGFLLVVIPVLGFYAAHGRLGRFLELYWLVPQAVASGYSNSHFPNPTWAPFFYALPVLLGGLLLASLLAGRPLRIARGWSQRRIVLVSALAAALISHLGALTRSDFPHLENTELALPAALCLAAFYLPELLGASSRRWRWIGGGALAVVVLALLPLSPYTSQPKLVALKLWRPLHARVSPPPQKRVPRDIPPGSVAAARIGRATITQRRCCTKATIPMAALVRFMDRLHAVVGTRRVYVDRVAGKTVTPPAVYFLADLRPATTPEDYGTMAFNSELQKQWYAYFASHRGDIQAIVTTSPLRRAPATWAAAFPSHRTVTIPLGRRTVYVLLH